MDRAAGPFQKSGDKGNPQFIEGQKTGVGRGHSVRKS